MAALGLIAAGAALGISIFAHLGHPLLWNDEAETAVFGQRVLIYGYPKIHHRGNVLYPINLPPETARKEESDAYIGIPWAHFYVAALGELLARHAGELYERTALLRLPFGAAGAAGVLLLGVGLAPAAAAAGAGRVGFVAVFLLLAALSTSLVLHLREVRYYPLAVLELGLLTVVHLRRSVYRRGRRGVQGAAISTLLVALFVTFYPLCAAAAAALALDAARRVWRVGESWRTRLSTGAREALPVLVAAVAIVPLLAYFETLHVAATFSARLGFSPSTYVDNVRALSWQLLRYEALAPAALTFASWKWSSARGPDELDATGREAAAFLWTMVVVHAAVACANPVLFGRYFVALTPLLVALGCLGAAQTLRARRSGRRATAAVSAVLLAGVLFLTAQWDILSSRLAEIREPVRGPLDFAIPFVRDSYEHPGDIVVATNYEAPAFEYYLGCTVAAVPRPGDASPLPAVDPDVVVPRRWWGNVGRLETYLRGDSWREQRFPVVDIPYNNIAELTNVSGRLEVLHQFRTPVTDDPGRQFLLYWRPRPGARAIR